MGLKLLTDFDGVWTDQADEARAVREAFVVDAAQALGAPVEDIARDFDTFLGLALAEPWDNGWCPEGELTAFVDEDPVLATASVAAWLDRGGEHPRADLWRRGLGRASAARFGAGGVGAHAHRSFGPAVRRFRDEAGHGLVPAAREVAAALGAAGVQILVVSNSMVEKLEELFARAGVEAGSDEDAPLRLVGGARKWQLGDGRDLTQLGDRYVRLDRPHYRALLAEERPDVVVGDVLSLDLALPSMLRFTGVLQPMTSLVLRRHAHTPPWTLEAQRAGVFDHVIDGLDELPALLEGLR